MCSHRSSIKICGVSIGNVNFNAVTCECCSALADENCCMVGCENCFRRDYYDRFAGRMLIKRLCSYWVIFLADCGCFVVFMLTIDVFQHLELYAFIQKNIISFFLKFESCSDLMLNVHRLCSCGYAACGAKFTLRLVTARLAEWCPCMLVCGQAGQDRWSNAACATCCTINTALDSRRPSTSPLSCARAAVWRHREALCGSPPPRVVSTRINWPSLPPHRWTSWTAAAECQSPTGWKRPHAMMMMMVMMTA